MANTYTQLYTQLVFSVKYRQAFIRPTWEEKLYQYITGIVQTRKHKMLAINGMPDHIHIYLSMHPGESISSLVKEIKISSTNFIKLEGLSSYKFQWQKGYGAFSYSKSHSDRVIKYVQNQKEHHQKKTFQEEYLALLHAFEIEYKEEYLFDFFD